MPNGMQDVDSSGTGRQQYMIGSTESGTASSESLSEILQTLKADSQTEVLKVVQEPGGKPSLLVALLTPERAQQLQKQYQGKVLVERDAPLQHF